MNAPMTLSPDALAKIDRAVEKYPPDQKQSAVMAALTIAQDEKGWLSVETMDFVAHYLGMPPIAVHEVTTFYNMYNQQPVGKYKLNVCTNLPCQLRDGDHATSTQWASAFIPVSALTRTSRSLTRITAEDWLTMPAPSMSRRMRSSVSPSFDPSRLSTKPPSRGSSSSRRTRPSSARCDTSSRTAGTSGRCGCRVSVLRTTLLRRRRRVRRYGGGSALEVGEHRAYSPMVVFAAHGQVELGEDGGDVLADRGIGHRQQP